MDGATHLSMQLQQAGIDSALINQVLKLKEIENLVNDGKVSKDVYDKLVDDVLKPKIEENHSTRSGNPKAKSKNTVKQHNNMMSRLRGVIYGSKKKSRKTNTKLSQNASVTVEKVPIHSTVKHDSPNSIFEPREAAPEEEKPVPQIIPVATPVTKPVPTPVTRAPIRSAPLNRNSVKKQSSKRELLTDSLMRLGQDKHGNAKWRKVKVILYDDSLVYYIKSKKGHIKNKKTVLLSEDFFVNAEINKQQLRKIYSSQEEEENGEAVFGQPHLFLLSDLDEHYYFAAEDEVKKEFWVSMLVQTIRDIGEVEEEEVAPKLGRMSVRDMSRSKKFVNKYDTIRKSHYQQKIRKTMRIGKLEDFKEENFLREEAKWKRQGAKLARESIAVDFRRQEEEKAKAAIEEQEKLKKKLADKEKALEMITKKYEENDLKWRTKYDNLLVEHREEAKVRNEEKEREREQLEQNIVMMQKQQAVTFRGVGPNNLSVEQQQMMEDYEKQLEQYKAKLSALESALNVDMSSLDWDGTLKDAEEKMQALVPDLMSENEDVRRDAQQKFDQWDNIVRNHADFKNREVKKWESWEQENFEKNLDALNEMKEKFVPPKYLTGISQADLITTTGCQKKTARRVMQNKIFKFFYMDKDRIAKIHIADLMNNYASQGLDIRELRAVYACLPDEFQNDNDGRKKDFRDNLRNRLAELTKKEENNQLSANEKMHNAYRVKEVKVVRKIAGGKPSGKRVKKNKAFQSKALALQAMLQKGGGGPPPAPKPAAAASSGSSSGIDPEAPEWKVYLKMKANGLPDGAIMNKMRKDGKDPSKWDELQKLAEGKGSGAASSGIDPNAPEWNVYLKMKRNGLPEGAIMNKMRKDGKDPSKWEELKALDSGKGSGDSLKISSKPKPPKVVNSKSAEWEVYLKMQQSGLPDGAIMNRMQKDGKDPSKWHTIKAQNNSSVATLPPIAHSRSERVGSATSFIDIPSLGPNLSPQRAKLDNAAIRDKIEGVSNTDLNILAPSATKLESLKISSTSDIKKRKSGKKRKSKTAKKKSLRKLDRRNGSKVHAVADAGALLSKAQLDFAVDKSKSTRTANLNLEYGRKTVKSSRNLKNVVDEGLQELVKIILEEGEHDPAEGGQKTIKFGDLSDRYESISDMLVGLLLKAKRQKLVKYRGDMLFKGIHDQIKITVK